MKAAQRWHIAAGSEYRVTGYDAEFADLSNPQGALVEELFFLVAETDRGDRRVYGTYASAELAEAAVPAAPPVVLWDEWYPVYGSEAYQASDEEASYAEWERANDGPLYGLRSTPTPGYTGRGW
jgi:hypothetical protein